MLKADLNTLLSFHDDLTELEIVNFVNHLDMLAREQGYPKAFETAMDKIHEYPTCDMLICSTAPYLDGALTIYGVEEPQQYTEQLERLYLRISKSDTPQARHLGTAMLISHCMQRQDYAKAEELIQSLPEVFIDKNEYLAMLCTKQGKYEEAAKLWERRILSAVAEIQTALMGSMEIAVREHRMEDANFYAELYESVTRQFSLADWTACMAQLQLSVERKNSSDCLAILKKMLPAMKERWNSQRSPLYQHLRKDETAALSSQMLDTIQRELRTSEEFSFLRDSEGYSDLIAQLGQ